MAATGILPRGVISATFATMRVSPLPSWAITYTLSTTESVVVTITAEPTGSTPGLPPDSFPPGAYSIFAVPTQNRIGSFLVPTSGVWNLHMQRHEPDGGPKILIWSELPVPARSGAVAGPDDGLGLRYGSESLTAKHPNPHQSLLTCLADEYAAHPKLDRLHHRIVTQR